MSSRTFRNKTDNMYKEKVLYITKELPSFAESFFNSLFVAGKVPSTVYEYARDINRFFLYIREIRPEFKDDEKYFDMPVSYLESISLDDLTGFLMVGNLGEKSRARRTASLRKFYGYYIKRQDISTNPALLLDTVIIHEKEIITLNSNEVINILDKVKEMSGVTASGNTINKRRKAMTRDYAIIVTLLGTGMRVSEMIGLDLSDVDMNDMCFHIVRKGNKEDRVYFGEDVKRAIELYLTDGREKIGADKSEPNALFLSLQHNRISARTIERTVKEFAKAAGLGNNITPHKFRSTYGTNLYNETGDIYLVADALGHSSVETTKKRYAKISESHKKLAAEVSSSLFLEK